MFSALGVSVSPRRFFNASETAEAVARMFVIVTPPKSVSVRTRAAFVMPP